MTTLPMVDTSCTAPSLMPTIIGNTFAASLRTDTVRSERKLVHDSRSESVYLNFLLRLCGLMDRRWRLTGYFPILTLRTAMEKLRIVILRFGTARQKMVLERWTNLKPLGTIVDPAAI
jgi:hypothetical protein